jgi:hypothetical protein
MIGTDDGLMYSAISDHPRDLGPNDTGYLNRRTGEIVFLTPTSDEATGWCGEEIAFEMVGKRASTENRPSDWIEIPKQVRLPVHHKHWCELRTRRGNARRFAPCTCGAAQKAEAEAESEDDFIRRFLRENGIDADW